MSLYNKMKKIIRNLKDKIQHLFFTVAESLPFVRKLNNKEVIITKSNYYTNRLNLFVFSMWLLLFGFFCAILTMNIIPLLLSAIFMIICMFVGFRCSNTIFVISEITVEEAGKKMLRYKYDIPFSDGEAIFNSFMEAESFIETEETESNEP